MGNPDSLSLVNVEMGQVWKVLLSHMARESLIDGLFQKDMMNSIRNTCLNVWIEHDICHFVLRPQ